MLEHIGIVACSAEGAALCYRTVCVEGSTLLGAHGHPEVSMHTHSLAKYVACLERGDWEGVVALMLASGQKLVGAGANFLICPDNTIHRKLAEVRARSTVPWLHIAEEVAAEAKRRGYRRLGLLGTRWLLDSEVYPEKLAELGIEYHRPGSDDEAELHRIIMEELVCGQFTSQAVGFIARLVGTMKEARCDAVVLGCTELPLILNDGNSPLPTPDSTRLLARAALIRAAGGAPSLRK